MVLRKTCVVFVVMFWGVMGCSPKVFEQHSSKVGLEKLIKMTVEFPDTVDVYTLHLPIIIRMTNLSDENLQVSSPSYWVNASVSLSGQYYPQIKVRANLKNRKKYLDLKQTNNVSVIYGFYFDRMFSYMKKGEFLIEVTFNGDVIDEEGHVVKFEEQLVARKKFVIQ